MLQIQALAMIPGMLRLTVFAVVSLSSRIHLELHNISLAMCLHQASLRQQLNSHLSALASWNGTAVLQPRKGVAQKIPEITQRSWSQWSKTKKPFQKSTKDMLTFSIKSFNRSILFPRMSSFFFSSKHDGLACGVPRKAEWTGSAAALQPKEPRRCCPGKPLHTVSPERYWFAMQSCFKSI